LSAAQTILAIDHVQIAVPVGVEQACRDFYLGVLGLTEIPRPEVGAGRSFLWARAGSQEVHFRPDPDFAPAQFAHPGFAVSDVEALASRVAAAGFDVSRQQSVGPGRFHTRDPFGNRLEFLQAG
jgi:catechol 2,3-dioxygenase-like lactoylglutathione lyase family enzyme